MLYQAANKKEEVEIQWNESLIEVKWEKNFEN